MISKLRNAFVRALYEDVGLPIVITDNNHKKPEYPFYSYKFTTLRQNVGEAGVYKETFEKSLDERFKYDVVNTVEFQPNVIMSFNSYSLDYEECEYYAFKAFEWFKLRGRRLLSYENIVVVDVSNITDRTIMLVDNYEYRMGFDVTFRVLHEFSDRFENIDSYKINGKIEGGKK